MQPRGLNASCGYDPRFRPRHSRRRAALAEHLRRVESDPFFREHYGERYAEAVDGIRSDLVPRPVAVSAVPRARGAGRPRGRRTVRSAARSGSSGDDGSGLDGGGDPAPSSPALVTGAGS